MTVGRGVRRRDAWCECPRLGGELSLVLRGWRREFALLSYSRMSCSKRNLKEVDKVTEREKKKSEGGFQDTLP